MNKGSWLPILAGLPLLLNSFVLPPHAAAASVQVILDGQPLTLEDPARIVNDRVLVPVRGLAEAMGGTVTWAETTRTVGIEHGFKQIKMKIEHRLVCLNQSCTDGLMSDVPAQIISDRTFVPVRIFSQALGANVSWDEATRTVVIATDKLPDYQIAPVTITSPAQGQEITGPISLQATGVAGDLIHFFLIDPTTGRGPIIVTSTDPAAAHPFLPDPTVTGSRLLVAGIQDPAGTMHYSDPTRVTLRPEPTVRLTGIEASGVVTGPITLSNEVNFVATHVTTKLLSVNGQVQELGTVGPGDNVTWYPGVAHNGDQWLQATAYDRSGASHLSPLLPIRVQSGHRTVLTGVKEGDALNRPINLRMATNYPLEYIQYFLDGQHLGWGYNFPWNFGPEMNGAHRLHAEVMDKEGRVRTVGPISFSVQTTPQVWMTGIAPRQVVTGAVTLKSTANTPIETVDYYLENPLTGERIRLGSAKATDSFTWNPVASQIGDRKIQAVARNAQGQSISSEKVSLRVYLGTIYGPKAIAPPAEFKEMASRFAVPSYRATGMAASLQVAQAILETGRGQYSPVDKYSGQPSNNMFGIKGTGPAGSVISNTWEEYNGVAVRVDDYFRAYNNVEESWLDHKQFLLIRPWYAPFRAVMANPVLGAWGLRKSGYATDSQYPVKLIRIMKENDLYRLDEIAL